MKSLGLHRRGFALIAVAITGLAAAGTCLTTAGDPGALKVIVKAGMEGDAKTAKAYLSANADYVRQTLPEIIRNCGTKSPKDTWVSFDLIFTVGHGGKVLSATNEPSNAFSSCVSEAVKGAKLTEPPRIPMDVYLEVSITR